ncbi:MAG: DedA family protein [Alphaproteobacteria bacterium]|nr:DedA family protein [Alphaproteobacteria bacterium]
MDVNAFAQSVLAVIEANQDWAGPITFLLAFGESLVIVGLLLPATVVFVGAGALVGLGVLDFWTLVMWGGPGAFCGDAVSYWLGRRYGPAMLRLWPMSRRPDLVEYTRGFFIRHGGKSVFIGRFFGPLRAMVPLIAGIMGMNQLRFQIANAASAMVWIVGILAPGAVVAFGLDEMLHHEENPVGYASAIGGLGITVLVAIWLRRQVRGSLSI